MWRLLGAGFLVADLAWFVWGLERLNVVSIVAPLVLLAAFIAVLLAVDVQHDLREREDRDV